MKVSKKSLLKK